MKQLQIRMVIQELEDILFLTGQIGQLDDIMMKTTKLQDIMSENALINVAILKKFTVITLK